MYIWENVLVILLLTTLKQMSQVLQQILTDHGIRSPTNKHTHTHTHTYTYVYTYNQIIASIKTETKNIRLVNLKKAKL